MRLSQGVRQHIRQNVVGYVALFCFAIGGTAMAVNAPRNTVVSRSIKNGNVKRVDLAKNAVDSTKVVNDSLTGDDILENTLSVSGAPPTGAAGGDLQGTYPDPTLDPPPPLTEVPLADDWQTLDALAPTVMPFQCYRDQLGVVHLSGWVERTAGVGPDGSVATLPQQCRPVAAFVQLILPKFSATAEGIAVAHVYLEGGTGLVGIDNGGSPSVGEGLSFDGVTFRGVP